MTTENDYYEEDEGLHFDPTEPEVINSYLIPMLRDEPMEDFIVVKDVYAKEPWLLDHINHPFLKEDEWYYVTPKTQISKEKIGCGKYSKRKIIGDGIDRGNWNANGKKDIIDEETGKVIGVKQNFTYHSASKNKNKKQKRGDVGSVSVDVPRNESWIMDEFRLPTSKDNDTFQGRVICKIHKKKWSEKEKKKEKKKEEKKKEKENDHHVEDKLDQELVVPCKIHKKRNAKKKKEKDSYEEASTSTNHYQHDESSSSSSSFWEQQKKEALGGEKVDEQVKAMETERYEDWIEELLGSENICDQDLFSIP